jgi:hypothetical protein
MSASEILTAAVLLIATVILTSRTQQAMRMLARAIQACANPPAPHTQTATLSSRPLAVDVTNATLAAHDHLYPQRQIIYGCLVCLQTESTRLLDTYYEDGPAQQDLDADADFALTPIRLLMDRLERAADHLTSADAVAVPPFAGSAGVSPAPAVPQEVPA